jgi:hypothetical protein
MRAHCVAPIQATAEIARQLRRLRRSASPVCPSARPGLEAAFGCDFHAVRIHRGPAAIEMADRIGAVAFCCGSDIVLGADLLAAPASVQLPILQHELAHASLNQTGDAIYCWMPGRHRELTRKVVGAYVGLGPWSDMLADASTEMDTREWTRLAKMGAAKVFGLSPPEGPQHGEGGEYKEDLEKAREINRKFQESLVQRAAEFYRIWEANVRASLPRRKILPVYWPLESAYFLISPFKKVIRYLGDALHVAQDRGAHSEGARGQGHHEPTVGLPSGYDPDDPERNPEGYKLALVNSKEVMDEFVSLTNFPSLPWITGK